MNTYYLHLGSNQGERKKMLEEALQEISTHIGTIITKSAIYETEPWGPVDQNDFLNMAIEVTSDLSPHKLLEVAQKIEQNLGRKVTEHWGPRFIDIDILYCGDKIISTETLNIPHKGIYDRNFVLIPMIEIAGEFIDPVKQLTIDELYDLCKDTKEVFLYEE